MLEKVRQRFSKQSISPSFRSKSLDDCSSTSVDSQSFSKLEISTSPLLNLPIDIFSLVTKYLLLADLISLSLTTKSLRHVCPSPSVYTFEPDTKAEAKCFARIHLRFLPPATILQEKSIRSSIFPRTSSSIPTTTTSSFKCPYCSHPLCSPNCATALFLDTPTGVFLPRSIYNIPKATFKYSPEYLSTNPHGSAPSMYKLLSMEGGYNPHRSAEPFVYSTIWCAHHRCPRGLLIPDSKRKHRSSGAKLFLEEYMQQWGELRFLLRVKSPSSTVRWSIWAEDFVGYELTMQPIRGGAEYGKKPVYEYAFYETICRHCGLVCKEAGMGSTVFERVCRCCGYTNDLGLGGCRRCGLVSVRFEVVEAFGGDGRRLAVATEWKEGVGGRLQPINPEKREKQLEIVRGRKLIEVTEKGRVGIMDLPAKVLKRIMEFVALQSEESNGQPFEMLMACYSFAKVWYELDYSGCCRQFELLEREKETNPRS
ncbi:hypothetical protein TWF718_007554 [Orbilia javanica]|uniref:F-box domain-containing protein n=1 Tax=Orbilia javanica TaxID=47235 RepID=A0AAN8N326_9PEZI